MKVNLEETYRRKLKVNLGEIRKEYATSLLYVARKLQELTNEKIYDPKNNVVEYDYEMLKMIKEANEGDPEIDEYYDTLVTILGICPYCECDLRVYGLLKQVIDNEHILLSEGDIEYSEPLVAYYCQKCGEEILMPYFDPKGIIYLHKLCEIEN